MESSRLQVPATFLFDLECFEQRLEVALAEALAAHAADDLEEQGGAVLQRLGEELQQVPLVVRADLTSSRTGPAERFLDSTASGGRG